MSQFVMQKSISTSLELHGYEMNTRVVGLRTMDFSQFAMDLVGGVLW